MRVKLLSFVAALLLVSACEGSPKMEAASEGYGEAASTAPYGQTSMGIGIGKVTMEDSEDYLVANVGNRVFFDFDKFNIKEPAADVLERQAQWLQDNPGVTITIEGNCDERGTREYNLALGDRRANATKDFLVALGVDANRIQTVSFGKEKPLALGSTEGAWALNRNATTVVN